MYLLATLALSELEFWLLSDFAVGEPTACCRCVALDIFDDEDDSRYDFFFSFSLEGQLSRAN